ncbi:glycosyltransferase family 4 protein [Geobacter sp.]|uniref:glycosyltransferase family 4 protein n=1 Tax=Geobacter sp. TaxID=46610 RepID=UPI002620494B|nr:glycosyltransferase family 4 protein [Geobacter sp.]
MKIGIAGPISTDNIARFLGGDTSGLPRGYYGAPLLGTLIGALLQRGHRITAFTTSSDMPLNLNKPVSAEHERFKIYYCPVRPRAFRPQNGHLGRAADFFRLEREALRRAILQDAPDLIHAHWTYEFAQATIDSGLPHLVTCHDAPQVVLQHMQNAYRLVRYFMARRVLERAQKLTAVSPYLQQKLKLYAKIPVSVIPNPIPDGLPDVGAKSCNFDPTRPHIAMILNGWGRRKNPEPALRAFALLRRRIPGAELHVMGFDFGPGEKAHRWAVSNGVADGVHFHGAQPYKTLLAKLASADLLLHPSLEETFGMSVAEAMALGVPVIGGSGSGAVPWVIGKGGLVTDVKSPEAIYESMCHMIEDVVTLKRYASEARHQAISRFSSTEVATRYESHYYEILAGGRG